ncbi:hypothetical protein DPMN_120993 [Dreissena polymorpha]|uniref:Uncharacterized protein n=1 Tax=Dreissena polymorpha TaxID=45954 RepID=A0A9D4JQP6_DREPO|nr:hypothetical protein DPMN_120993 [Dreissena polymorpha]
MVSSTLMLFNALSYSTGTPTTVIQNFYQLCEFSGVPSRTLCPFSLAATYLMKHGKTHKTCEKLLLEIDI